MRWLFWLVAALSLIVLVAAFLDPRKLWWRTTAWQFRDPEANEPSEAAFTASRIGLAVLGAGGLILTLLGFVWTAPPDIGSQIRAAADRLAADGPITIESLGQLPTTQDRRTTPAAAVEDALTEETTDGGPLLRITSTDTPVPDKQFLFTITGTPDGGAFCLELTTTMPPTDRVTTGSSLYLPGQQTTVAVPPTVTGREAPVVAEVFEGACATVAHSAVRW